MKRSLSILLIALALSAQTNMKQGDERYRAGDYRGAIDWYRKSLKAEENPPITHFNLGNCWFQLDSLAQAAVHYSAVLREAPEFSRAYLNLGIVNFTMNRFGEAVAVLERGRLEDPANLTMIQVLAESYRQLQRIDKAVPLYQEILRRDSTKTELLFTLADLMRSINDPDEAMEMLKRYPDSGSRFRDKLAALAEIAEEQKRFGEALFYRNQLIAHFPNDRWAYYRIITLTEQLGNPLSAVIVAQETVKKFPDFADAALKGANIAFAEKQFDLAEQLYLHAYRHGSSGGMVGLNNCARIYRSLGNTKAADRIAAAIGSK